MIVMEFLGGNGRGQICRQGSPHFLQRDLIIELKSWMEIKGMHGTFFDFLEVFSEHSVPVATDLSGTDNGSKDTL